MIIRTRYPLARQNTSRWLSDSLAATKLPARAQGTTGGEGGRGSVNVILNSSYALAGKQFRSRLLSGERDRETPLGVYYCEIDG